MEWVWEKDKKSLNNKKPDVTQCTKTLPLSAAVAHSRSAQKLNSDSEYSMHDASVGEPLDERIATPPFTQCSCYYRYTNGCSLFECWVAPQKSDLSALRSKSKSGTKFRKDLV